MTSDSSPPEQEIPAPEGFDTARRFIRVIERRPDGFIEFHFSIGDPNLFVEMFLDEAKFEEFCAQSDAVLLDAGTWAHDELHDPIHAALESNDESAQWNWTMHDAAHHRLN